MDGVAVGVCGTDKEIVAGDYGWAPPGEDRLILGHESLGRVREAPQGSGFAAGDLVVGVVRRPDPEPCGACAHGEFDMCRNGRYTERGIKERHGYASQAWTVESEYAVRLDPGLESVGMLLEPTTVVAKAWEQVERVGGRAWFEPRRALVTGAGPLGLLARCWRAARPGRPRTRPGEPGAEAGPGRGARRDVPQRGHRRGDLALRPDVVIEATGAGSLVFASMAGTATYGVVCLTGVSPAGRKLSVDAGSINRDLVLENDVVVGSVNANLRHYHQGAEALAKADRAWLERMITRRVPLERAAEAFTPRDDDIKVAITLT